METQPKPQPRERTEVVLRVADFTRTPGARYGEDGDWSGEWFRKTYLAPKFLEVREVRGILIVDLDGVVGYATSFLEEAFGGLVRQLKLKPAELMETLRVVCTDEPELVAEVRGYINEAR